MVHLLPPRGTLECASSGLPLRRWEGPALIDTGSQATLIRSDVAEVVGLDPRGVTRIQHPIHGGPVECMTTFGEASIQGEDGRCWTLDIPLVVAQGLMTPFVLGMDAFEQGELIIDFVRRRWGFSVPPRLALGG